MPLLFLVLAFLLVYAAIEFGWILVCIAGALSILFFVGRAVFRFLQKLFRRR